MIAPLDFNAGVVPEQSSVVDLSEPREQHVPEGVPAAPEMPPTWPDLKAALADVSPEDQSHAVEAWRDLVVQNGRQHADWSGTDEDGVKGFTDQYQDEIKANLKFDPKGKPYAHLANEIAIDPMRPADGLNEAYRAGLIDRPSVHDYQQAIRLQGAVRENAALMQAAGMHQEGKALAVGAGRGAAFMAGALPAGYAAAATGPATYGVGPLLAGAIGGTITSMGYDELLDKIAENNKTIESFSASSKLHPNWTAGGELVSFAIPAPLGVARGIRRFQLVAENLGPKAAINQAAKYVAVSGGVGAASTPIVGALDRWKNEALGLGHDPEQSLFDSKSIAANTVLAIMLGNLGVKFTKYSQGEAASIHQRGMAGEKLTPAETEVFTTINRAIAKDPKKFVFEVEQATMGGKPLDGAVAARTQSGTPNGAASGGPQSQSGPTPGATGATGSTGTTNNNTQQGQESAQTGATGSASNGGASQRSRQQTGTGGTPALKPRRFTTQADYNDFLSEAAARGDVEAANAARSMNDSKWFSSWWKTNAKASDRNGLSTDDVVLFGNSVMSARSNKAHAEFVRQQKSGNQGNGPEPTGQASNAAGAQRGSGGTTSPESGNGPGVSSGGRSRNGDAASQEPSRLAVAPNNESLGANTAGGLSTTAAPSARAALNGTAAALGGASMSPFTTAAGANINRPSSSDDKQPPAWLQLHSLALQQHATAGDAGEFTLQLTDGLHEITRSEDAQDLRSETANRFFRAAGQLAQRAGFTGQTIESLLTAELSRTYGNEAPEMAQAITAQLEADAAPQPAPRFGPKKKAGIRAINELLGITGETPEPGQSIYVVADEEGTPIEVFTTALEGHQHLQSMAGPDEWLWSMPSDYNGEAVLEGGMPPRNHPKDRSAPVKDPFGNKFRGEVPAPGSRTPAPIEGPTETTVKGTGIVQVPLDQITLSTDVPQFKKGANSRGVVEPLEGDYDPTGNVLQGWRRLDGRIELISGRHRFAKAQESDVPSVAMQIHNEADGFTARHAARLDAELNIRDGQGTVSDYVSYFKNSGITEEAAKQRGLLARAKGKAGFSIARGASDDLLALFNAGEITDAQAQAIAEAAPGNADVQRIGTRAALQGKSAAYVGNLIKAFNAQSKGKSATQLDLLGQDDSAMRKMEEQAKAASAAEKGIRDQINAVQGAAKRPDVARKLGVDVKDPDGIQKRIGELKAELDRWENWPMHSDLVAITRGEPSTTPVVTPKLRPGENQGDLLSNQTEGLTLAGEKGTDTLKAAADKEAADRAAAEAKAIQERDQGSLFETEPEMPSADVLDFGEKILTDGMDFTGWGDKMISKLGEKVAPVLHEAWARLTMAEQGPRNLKGERMNVRNETGAIFGRGRRRRGQQPDALPEEERILSTRAFWEGSADAFLGKPMFRPLGRAINKQVDLVDKRLGDTTGKLVAWESRTPRSQQAEAKETLSRFIDARESGHTADARAIRAGATPAGKDLIKTVEEIADYTGRVSTTLVQPNGRVGVEVMDGATPRPLRNLGKEFWPRILKGEYDAALRDPLSNPALWQQMRQDLVANGNIANIANADQFLKGGGGNDAANEFLGSLYQARSGRLPAHWHDTSLEGFANWATRWSDIVSKIEAFGQKIRPTDTDVFEDALNLTTHAPTRSYINSARARAYNERNVGFMAKYLLDAPRLLASGLFLTNPVTMGINYASAKLMNTFTYGLAATHFRNPLAKFSKQNHLDAYALGVLKADMVRLLYRDDMPGLDALKNFTNGAMKLSGYETVENLTRVDTYLTALAFLHDGLAAIRRNPESSSAVKFMAFLKRNKYDIGAIVRENGRGDATDSFLRSTIKDTQGGYAYNQVPWWTDTPLGKFFLQFSKFSTQLTRNVMRNVIRPAFAMDTVTFRVNGKTITKRHWDPRPLLYLIAGSVAAGDAVNTLKDLAFGIERKDATIDEIAHAMDESTRDGLALIAVRMLNDAITLGTLGIFGTPIQTMRDVTERSKFRNPLAPPGVSLATNAGNLIQSGLEQGQITSRDMKDFAASSVSMYRYADAFVKQQAHNLGIKWRAAELKARQDDVAFLRSAANRYAESVDLPKKKVTSAGRNAKDELTPMRADLIEALLLGEEDKARVIIADYLKEFPSIEEKKAKLESLASTVANNQPARVGGIAGNERRVEFMQWAKEHLSAKDIARIQAVDEGYRTTANAVGLMRMNTPAVDERLLLIQALRRERLEETADPDAEEQFLERTLAPHGGRRRTGGMR